MEEDLIDVRTIHCVAEIELISDLIPAEITMVIVAIWLRMTGGA